MLPCSCNGTHKPCMSDHTLRESVLNRGDTCHASVAVLGHFVANWAGETPSGEPAQVLSGQILQPGGLLCLPWVSAWNHQGQFHFWPPESVLPACHKNLCFPCCLFRSACHHLQKQDHHRWGYKQTLLLVPLVTSGHMVVETTVGSKHQITQLASAGMLG